MTKEIIVHMHITYDDLSEQTKKDIEKLRSNGAAVKIIWPMNDFDKTTDITQTWPNITPSMPPISIGRKQHEQFDDDNTWKKPPDIMCSYGKECFTQSDGTKTKTFN